MSATSRVLTFAVVVALVGGGVSGVLAEPPGAGPPGYALHALVVWRIEVAAAVTGALYGGAIVVALALDGETISRIGPGGVDIPTTRRQPATADEEMRAETCLLRERIARLEAPPPPPKPYGPSTTHQMNVKYLRQVERTVYGDEHERDDDTRR